MWLCSSFGGLVRDQTVVSFVDSGGFVRGVGRAVDSFVVREFVVWKGRWICLWRGCLVVSVDCSFSCQLGSV